MVSPRRIRWTMRAVLYGTLLALVLALWAARPGEKVVLAGKTSQGQYFDLEARDDGEVDAFDTRLVAECDDGQTVEIRWWPWDGDPVAFERDGERLDVREEWRREEDDGVVETGWATLDGRVSSDGRSASGVVTAQSTFSRTGADDVVCRATDVTWRASAG